MVDLLWLCTAQRERSVWSPRQADSLIDEGPPNPSFREKTVDMHRWLPRLIIFKMYTQVRGGDSQTSHGIPYQPRPRPLDDTLELLSQGSQPTPTPFTPHSPQGPRVSRYICHLCPAAYLQLPRSLTILTPRKMMTTSSVRFPPKTKHFV